MIQMQLISSVIEVERKIAFEEDRIIGRRFEPYANYLAAAQRIQMKPSHSDEESAPADFIQALKSNL